MSGTEKSSVEVVYGRLADAGLLPFVREFARRRGIPMTQLLSRQRPQSTSKARVELFALVHDTLGLSFPETGRLFDRDHTTIMSAVNSRRAELDRLYAPLAKATP